MLDNICVYDPVSSCRKLTPKFKPHNIDKWMTKSMEMSLKYCKLSVQGTSKSTKSSGNLFLLRIMYTGRKTEELKRNPKR